MQLDDWRDVGHAIVGVSYRGGKMTLGKVDAG